MGRRYSNSACAPSADFMRLLHRFTSIATTLDGRVVSMLLLIRSRFVYAGTIIVQVLGHALGVACKYCVVLGPG
jgi:hypothetical protein